MAPPSTLLERWSWWARGPEANRPAVIDTHGSHTYRALDAAASAIAGRLRAGERGVSLEAGQRVALLLPPGAVFLSAFFGVLRAGGVATILSPLHPEAEMRFFLEDAEARALLVAPSWLEPVKGLVELAARGLRVIPLAETLEESPASGRPFEPPREEDPALQLYTSGTTGKPKGAVLSHANLGKQQVLLGQAWGWSKDDVLLHALPLHHLHGLGIALLTALGAGATARMLPQFDASLVWESMAESTVFMAVPTMYTKLFAAFDAAPPETQRRWTLGARHLRLATSGSAALPVGLAERWRALTGDIPLERFGMTEIGVGMTNPLDGPRRAGCVGRALPTVETRVTPEGELWVRGPSVFSTYWKRPESTESAFAPDPDGGAPWFRTGDNVEQDADGAFRILGRTSVDILKSGGYKLSALEIEEVLREHPAVAECAVVGMPDETWGERVVACVVPVAGREEECGEELRRFARKRIAAYKVPKEVFVFSELPRNTIGKVQKKVLVAEVEKLAKTRTGSQPER